MPHSPCSQDKRTQRLPFGSAILTALFGAFFTLSLTIVIFPRFFNSFLAATLAGIIGLAVIYSSYAVMVRGLRLPFLVHGLFFLLFQWLGQFRTCLEMGNFPAGLWRPFTLIHDQPLWFVVTMSGGLIVFFLSDTLLALEQIPKVIPPNRREIFNETLYMSGGPWEQNWKSWRFSIFGAVIITAACYLVGLKQLTLFMGILFWLQLGLGVWLILIGHYYYKRAVWKLWDLTPEPEMKQVWGQGLAVWFGIAAMISLVLPVHWRLDQWWLIRLFQSLQQFFIGNGGPTVSVPDMSGKIQPPPPEIPPGDSSWIKALIVLLYNCLILFIALAGLLLLLILIGYLIQRFWVKEADRLKGLPKALLKLYLIWRELWRKRGWKPGWRKRFKTVPEGVGTDESKDPDGKMKRGYSFGQGPRAVIRRGYYRLIRAVRLDGYPWREDQTPQEIASDLNAILPESEEALSGIADSYQQARYGPKPPPGGLAQMFEKWRREVQNRFRFLK